MERATAGERKEREGLEEECLLEALTSGHHRMLRMSHQAPASSTLKFILSFQCGGLFNQPIGLEGQRRGEFYVLVNMTSTRAAPGQTQEEAGDQDKALLGSCLVPLGAPSHVLHALPRSPRAGRPVCLEATRCPQPEQAGRAGHLTQGISF